MRTSPSLRFKRAPDGSPIWVSEPVSLVTDNYFGGSSPKTVRFRIDGRHREQEGYRIDQGGMMGWEAIDGGRGPTNLIDARRLVKKYLEAIQRERTLTPSSRDPKSQREARERHVWKARGFATVDPKTLKKWERVNDILESGRNAERAGHFKSAAVWYAKAAALLGKGARGRMWKRRAADLKKRGKNAEMGTLYQRDKGIRPFGGKHRGVVDDYLKHMSAAKSFRPGSRWRAQELRVAKGLLAMMSSRERQSVEGHESARDAVKKRRTPKKRASGGPHGFHGAGKKPGSYYVTGPYSHWDRAAHVVAQNFRTREAAEKWARGKKLSDFKVWRADHV